MYRKNHNASLLFVVRRGVPNKKKAVRKKALKKAKKSDFVRFFESLQERGPLHPIEGKIYDRWTRQIRTEMETENTWPVDQQKPDIAMIAEYVSRLMRLFWKSSHGRKWYRYDKMRYEWNLGETMRPQLNAFFLIFEKIREKGRRDRSFELSRPLFGSIAGSAVRKGWLNWNHSFIKIEPYTPFNDHGVGI